MGGEDAALSGAIAQITEAELNKTVIFYNDALTKEEFNEVDKSFLPVYLLEKNADTSKKFEQFIQRGMLKETDKYIVFNRQTRSGVFMNEPEQKGVLEIFVMSQCPYGAMAENKIIDAMKAKRIPEGVTVKLRYLGGVQGEGFRSLHGTAEWEENVRQLLIQKHYPKKFWKYLEIRNKDYQSSLWPAALEEAGISVSKINKMFEKEGKQLFREDIAYGEKYGAGASPTYLWQGRVMGDPDSLSNFEGLEFLKSRPVMAPGVLAAPQPAQPAADGSC